MKSNGEAFSSTFYVGKAAFHTKCVNGIKFNCSVRVTVIMHFLSFLQCGRCSYESLLSDESSKCLRICESILLLVPSNITEVFIVKSLSTFSRCLLFYVL